MTSTMHIDVIKSLETLIPLEETWKAVYDADPGAQFFLSWTWISGCLERVKRGWFVLAAKPDADASTYAAFFPLRYRGRKTKGSHIVKEIAMAGNRSADYTGFICIPEFQERAIATFAAVIKKLDWQSFHLENICMWNKRNIQFLDYFSERNFSRTRLQRVNKIDNIDNTVCPYVELPNDWRNYIQNSLSSNMRRKVRRYLEKVENSSEFHVTRSNHDTIGRDMDILLELWSKKWGEKKGDKLDGIFRIFRAMLTHCFHNGVVFFPILWHGDRPIAAVVCLDDKKNKSRLMFVAGRDLRYQTPPPGLVLQSYCIKQAIQSGYKTYDFLRGNEPYKYLFGAKERSIAYIVVQPRFQAHIGR